MADHVVGSSGPGGSSDEVDALLDIECPRCGVATRVRFYGPCTTCVGELFATQRKDAGDYVAPEYTPKMNVVPNQVATKD